MALLFNAIAVFLIVSSWSIAGVIAPGAAQFSNKNLYIAPLDLGVTWPYTVVTDTSNAPFDSTLILLENDRKLGPPHSLHVDIASVGAGAYSYWLNKIYFSASDNSDPRTNGRHYSFVADQTLTPSVKSFLLATLLVADLIVAFSFRAALKARLPGYWDAAELAATRLATFAGPWLLLIAMISAGLISALTIMAATGVFGSVTLAKTGPPKDTALTFAVAGHAALCCILSIGLWAAAAGLLRAFLHFRNATVAQLLLPAFPLSLVVTAALSCVALTLPHGHAIAVVCWLACLVPLLTWRPPARHLNALVIAAAAIVPLAMAYGIWLGLLWHGPTDTLAGAPSGDVTFYAGSIWTLAAFPSNIHLGYENDPATTYFNQLYPALGATLLQLPGFDPFLFILCGGGTAYVLFTCLSLHIFLAERPPRSIGVSDAAVVLMSIVVAARYPYWVAESIPVVFAPAVAVSVWWMTECQKDSARWSVAAVLAATVGTALSKVTSAMTLLPLAAGRFAFRLLQGSVALRVAFSAIGVTSVVYCALMLVRFLPQFLAAAPMGPESFRFPLWYFYLRDVSTLLLIVLAWFTTVPAVAASLTIGLASFLVYSFIAHVNLVIAVIIFGLSAASMQMPSVKRKLCLLVVFCLMLPALILGEPSAPFSAVVWFICIGTATSIAIAAAEIAELPVLKLRHAAFGAMFTVALATLFLFGVSRGNIIVDSGLRSRDALTPQTKQIWAAVRENTPRDALIFTDQVDDTINLLGGWNTFAFSGQRQLFISSYYTSRELRGYDDKRDRVLAMNAAVLSGAQSPRDLVTKHRHGSYYAVVAAERIVPAGWQKITANRLYTLYEIPG